MKLSFKLHGVPEAIAKLEAIKAAAAGGLLERAVLAGALVLTNSAKERAPVLTGNLRRSLHEELVSSSRMRATAAIGSDVEYAPYVEFGTRFMAAQSYLRAAADVDGRKAIAAIEQVYKQELGR